ncbi:MAG TPA: hypothetical protein VF364_08360 [Candidatus Limnocylindria bacterium]
MASDLSGGRDSTDVAPRPPSERGDRVEERQGVGVFRYAGCGWGLTIALFLLVGTVMLVGYLRDDPGRNPAPAAYRAAVCAAFDELSQGTRALERGEGLDGSADRAAASDDVERHVEAANEHLAGLPVWEPGRSLDELIGSQIITLTNGAVALEEGSAEGDLEIALGADAVGRDQLASGRYGFTC